MNKMIYKKKIIYNFQKRIDFNKILFRMMKWKSYLMKMKSNFFKNKKLHNLMKINFLNKIFLIKKINLN